MQKAHVSDFYLSASFSNFAYLVKSVILISASLLFIGSAMRNAATERNLLPLLFVGQFVGQFSRAIALPYAGRLANLWFKPNEISKAVGIGTSGFTLGTALGYVIPGRDQRTVTWKIDELILFTVRGSLI